MKLSLKTRFPLLILMTLGISSTITGCFGGSARSNNKLYTNLAMHDMQSFGASVRIYEKYHGKLETNDFSTLIGSRLKTIPKDPWGNNLTYNFQNRKITSYGSDGRPGGTEDAAEDNELLKVIPLENERIEGNDILKIVKFNKTKYSVIQRFNKWHI